MFCEIKSGDMATANEWYRRCEKEHWPYIVVTHRRKYSAVNWDHVSLPKEADAKLDGCEVALEEVYDRHARKRSKGIFSAKVGRFDNMLPEEARAAAREIYGILTAALSRTA